MLEDDGHWLRLMRTATIPTDANICLRISGRDIVCTVTKDVNKEVELKVTCRIADPCHEQKPDSSLLSDRLKSPPAPKLTEVELEERETVPKDCTSPKTMLDCVSNSVCSYSDTAACSNSSLNSRDVSEERSLKSENVDSDIDMDDFKEEVSSSTTRESPSSDPNREVRIKSEEEAQHLTSKSNDLELRKSKVNDENILSRSPESAYSVTESYLYDKNSRHHYSSSISSRSTSSLSNPKSFCDACKIQFMSVNTYQVHKKFYCKSRHESEDYVPSVPVLEAGSGALSAAFKPAADTVILRGGMNGTITPTVIQPQAIYAAISTNPLILLPCSLVPGQGLVPQNGVISTGAPGIVLQSGIACPTIVEKPTASKIVENNCPPRKTSHPVMNTTDESTDNTLLSSSKIAVLKRKMSEGDVLNLKKPCPSSEPSSSDKNVQDSKDNGVALDSPLDLSMKFKKGNDSSSRKSPVRRRSSVISAGHPASPVHRVCGSGSPPGPSVISSSHSSSPPMNSYSNESFTSQVPVVVHRVPPVISDRISPLPPVLQSAVVDKTVPTPGILPPKLMKQGNNICEECHIVFFKYDNLVTHKKHYCAYRRQQLSALALAAAAAVASSQEQSSDDNNSNHSGNEGTPNFQADDPGKSGLRKLEYGVEHYRQVISKPPQPVYCCDACGVKFSTSDTLEAHQTYYCMKKPDSAMAKASNRKGEDSSSGNIESPFSGPEEWKCNYCDATCSSYETIRRHLLTHSEPRGYRCLLCGYKGNTLRGMRTHACEHLTEDTASIEEFMSSTVISEAGVIPVIPRTVECSDDDSNQQKESLNFRHRERTSSNNSDIAKDSAIKHERVIAEFSESEELSNSPRSGENIQKDSNFKRGSSVKAESGDSSSDISANNQETVNPLAFCDVVIKSENEVSATGDDSDRHDVKSEQEQDYDSDEKPQNRHPRSVIRVAEKHEDVPPSKRKSKSHTRSNPDLKSCKTCGVSFQHLSNLLTHKKYYCSRTLQNCLPETATVQ